MKLPFLPLLLLATLATSLTYAQFPTCGTASPTPEQARLHEEKFREFVMRAKQANRGRTQAQNVAVKVWIIQPDGGWYNVSPQIPNILSNLNGFFSPIGVTFFQIESPTVYYDPSLYSVDANSINKTLWKRFHYDNAINLYFVGQLCNGSKCSISYEKEGLILGVANTPFSLLNPRGKEIPSIVSAKEGNWIAISTDHLYYVRNNPTKLAQQVNEMIFKSIPHEFGHYFNLYHTFSQGQETELVNGNNCADAGDYVCDTPADPIDPNSTNNGIIVNCSYSGPAETQSGLKYNPKFWNMMAYYPIYDQLSGYKGYFTQSCQKVPEFTPGQYLRMVAGLLWRTTPHPDLSSRYYIDGQKHLVVDKLSSDYNSKTEITQLCAGTSAFVSAYFWGATWLLYTVQVVNEATGAVASTENGAFLNQYYENYETKNGGTIQFKLPANLPAGRYRLRLINSVDGFSEVSKAFDIATPTTARLTGTATIQERDSTQLRIDLTGGTPAALALSNGQKFTATASPFTFFVKPTRSTTYRLASVSNGCGAGTVTADSVRITVIPITALEPGLPLVGRVYPNPATELLRVELPGAGPYRLQLLDARGQVVAEQSGSGANPELSLRRLAGGLYLLRLGQGGRQSHFRVLKQ